MFEEKVLCEVEREYDAQKYKERIVQLKRELAEAEAKLEKVLVHRNRNGFFGPFELSVTGELEAQAGVHFNWCEEFAKRLANKTGKLVAFKFNDKEHTVSPGGSR